MFEMKRLPALIATFAALAVASPSLAQDAPPIPAPAQSVTSPPQQPLSVPSAAQQTPNLWPDGTPINSPAAPTAAPPADTSGTLPLDEIVTPEERQLIDDISLHNSQIKTMVGRFQQINSDGTRVEGSFYLQRPDKIRFRYDPPSREEIISVGRGFYVIDRREKTKYAYPQDKVPLREFLTDRIDLFRANITNVVLSEQFISITIRDDTPMGPVDVALIFDRTALDLRQWTLSNSDGSQITFTLSDVKTGVSIPKSYFYIDPTYKAAQQ
jgi:outer membrane lipoprotein-sorting protein